VTVALPPGVLPFSPEWVLGQGFLNTEAEGGPRGATEKRVLPSGEAPSPDRKTAHAQIGLQLHVMSRQQCRNARDFQDNGFVRQAIGPESKRQRFAFIHRRNTNFAPDPNAGTLQRPAQRGGVKRTQQSWYADAPRSQNQ
jgi:hypothetical protein